MHSCIHREKTDQEIENVRLEREVRDASNRLQAMHTKYSAAEKVNSYIRTYICTYVVLKCVCVCVRACMRASMCVCVCVSC